MTIEKYKTVSWKLGSFKLADTAKTYYLVKPNVLRLCKKYNILNIFIDNLF